MKPLPNLDDEAAMLLRGRRSALAAARNETEIALRDAYTSLQVADWPQIADKASEIKAIAERLMDIGQRWDEVNA